MCVCVFQAIGPYLGSLCVLYMCVCVRACVRACVCDLSNQSNRETHVTCLKPLVDLTTYCINHIIMCFRY